MAGPGRAPPSAILFERAFGGLRRPSCIVVCSAVRAPLSVLLGKRVWRRAFLSLSGFSSNSTHHSAPLIWPLLR